MIGGTTRTSLGRASSLPKKAPENPALFLCARAGVWFVPGHAATIPASHSSGSFVRALAITVKVLLFLLLLGFAALNSDAVTLRYFLGLQWQAPMSLVILVVFAIGLLTGLLACSVRLLRSHREVSSLRKAMPRE